MPGANGRRLAILSSSKLAQLRAKQPGRLRTIERHAWLIVAIEDRDPGSVIDAAKAGNGIIFTRIQSDRLPLVLSLAQLGYCAIPSPLASTILRGPLRCELLHLLNPAQAKALRLLGLGFTNQGIALALQMDVGRTKYLIRSLLKVLHFRNRTQAAVFATRDAFPPAGGPDRGHDTVSCDAKAPGSLVH